MPVKSWMNSIITDAAMSAARSRLRGCVRRDCTRGATRQPNSASSSSCAAARAVRTGVGRCGRAVASAVDEKRKTPPAPPASLGSVAAGPFPLRLRILVLDRYGTVMYGRINLQRFIRLKEAMSIKIIGPSPHLQR